jgi:hypothetical protein
MAKLQRGHGNTSARIGMKRGDEEAWLDEELLRRNGGGKGLEARRQCSTNGDGSGVGRCHCFHEWNGPASGYKFMVMWGF